METTMARPRCKTLDLQALALDRTTERPTQRVRNALTAQLTAAKHPEVIDDVALIAVELVTNAIRHANGCATFMMAVLEDGVLVAVQDKSPQSPQPEPGGLDDEGGRGLHIVSCLATQWGWAPTDRGKEVWALIQWPKREESACM